MHTELLQMTARDIMSRRLITVQPETDVESAIDLLLANRISGAPVVDKRVLVGILSEKDCLNLVAQSAMYDLPHGRKVKHFMTTEVIALSPDTDVATIAGLFLRNAFRRVPIVDAARVVVGVVSRRDVLRGMQRMRTRTHAYPDYRRPT